MSTSAYPFLLDKIRRDMNRLFENQLSGERTATGKAPAANWLPPVDIKEDSRQFVLYADMPGVDPASIDITMEHGVLVLQGERMSGAASANLRRQERLLGRFERRFVMPDSADGSKISAQCRHGVLQIIIPKTERAKPRRIEVQG